MRARRFLVRSCVAVLGYTECGGAAYRGEHACTCGLLFEELPSGELARVTEADCLAAAAASDAERAGKPCHDCAFRRGSPEAEAGELPRLLASDRPFRCHQGMPLDARDSSEPPGDGDYLPHLTGHGLGLGAGAVIEAPAGYPVCAGWLRAKREALDEILEKPDLSGQRKLFEGGVS